MQEVFHIDSTIQVKGHMNVKFVERLSSTSITSWSIKDFTVVKSHTSATGALKSSLTQGRIAST